MTMIHPVVLNPYTPLSLLPAQVKWFTCLDLKDAFFCPRLEPASQPILAFEWEDLYTGRKTELTWTRLPQGFKNSPTLFGEALAMNLTAFPGEALNCTLLQYVEDLLLASPSQEDCWKGTQALLALLLDTGYKVSWKKAQICKNTVRYLGFIVSEGYRILGPERKQAICAISQPGTKKEVQGFLGAAEFCQIWIPGFSNIVKPLYDATVGSGKEPLDWGPKQEEAFDEIKGLLTRAPALELPDVMREFNLFIHEKNHTALGVLTQTVGPWQQPVAYLSKRLDPVASG